MLPVIRREDVEQPGALSMVGSIDQFEVNVEGALGPLGPLLRRALEQLATACSGMPAGG
jgi:hypothetical protein